MDDDTIIFWEPVTYGYYVDAAPNLILDSVLDLFLKSHNFTEFLPILEQVIRMIRRGTPTIWYRYASQGPARDYYDDQGVLCHIQ